MEGATLENRENGDQEHAAARATIAKRAGKRGKNRYFHNGRGTRYRSKFRATKSDPARDRTRDRRIVPAAPPAAGVDQQPAGRAGDEHGGEDPVQLADAAQAQVPNARFGGRAQAGTVQVGDHRQLAGKAQQAVTHPRASYRAARLIHGTGHVIC
jgi:hypothetical protein